MSKLHGDLWTGTRINPGLYSSNDHTWETPPSLIAALLAFEGRTEFDLDAACSRPNIPANRRITFPGDDALRTDWREFAQAESPLCWINPPYGALLRQFMEKCVKESLGECRIWLLVPARTDTKYMHKWGLASAGFVVFLSGRLRFWQRGVEGGSAPFPSMLLYYGTDGREKARRWCAQPPLAGTIMHGGRPAVKGIFK